MEKRQEFKTKSTPPSLEYSSRQKPQSTEFSVLKPTPKIIEPKDSSEKCDEMKVVNDDITNLKIEIDDTEKDDNVMVTSSASESGAEHRTEDSGTSESVCSHERVSQSPERLLDSSTDSVPPSESSMESSQTCTSSLESSSLSPPLEESSLSSEKVGLFHLVWLYIILTRYFLNNLELFLFLQLSCMIVWLYF